jgi:hypothetical protein
MFTPEIIILCVNKYIHQHNIVSIRNIGELRNARVALKNTLIPGQHITAPTTNYTSQIEA